MKAFFITSYGGPEVMRYGDLPDPSPAREEVLVAVKAASLNPLDFKIRRGDFRIVTGSRAFAALESGRVRGKIFLGMD